MEVVDAIRNTPLPEAEKTPIQDDQDHEGDDRQRVIQALVRASSAFVGAESPLGSERTKLESELARMTGALAPRERRLLGDRHPSFSTSARSSPSPRARSRASPTRPRGASSIRSAARASPRCGASTRACG